MTAPGQLRVNRPAGRPAGPDPRTVTLVLAVLVAGSYLLAIQWWTPTPVRALLILPVLALVGGASAADLVVRHRAAPDGSRPGTLPTPRGATENSLESTVIIRFLDPIDRRDRATARGGLHAFDGDDEPDGSEPLGRAPLTGLFALLILLAAVMVLPLLRFTVQERAIILTTTVITSLLLVAARWSTVLSGPVLVPGGAPGRGVAPGRSRETWWPARPPRPAAVLGLLASVAVLVAAVAGAIALQPVPVERYSLLTLDDPAAVHTGARSVKPGAPVTLGWTLRGYNLDLPTGAPAVAVTVGGVPVQASAPAPALPVPDTTAGAGSRARQRGTVGFTAPGRPGLYPVRVTVTPDGGVPAELGLMLEVVR